MHLFGLGVDKYRVVPQYWTMINISAGIRRKNPKQVHNILWPIGSSNGVAGTACIIGMENVAGPHPIRKYYYVLHATPIIYYYYYYVWYEFWSKSFVGHNITLLYDCNSASSWAPVVDCRRRVVVVGRVSVWVFRRWLEKVCPYVYAGTIIIIWCMRVIYFTFLSVSEDVGGVVRPTHIPNVYLVHDD